MKRNLFGKATSVIAAFCIAAMFGVHGDEYDELNCKASSSEDSDTDHGEDSSSGCPDVCYTWDVTPGYEYCESDSSAGNCDFCIKRLNEDGATLNWYYATCEEVDGEEYPILYTCVSPDAAPYDEDPTDEVYAQEGTDCEQCDEDTGEPVGGDE